MTASELNPQHFLWRVERTVAVITLSRPEKKNPLTSTGALTSPHLATDSPILLGFLYGLTVDHLSLP